LIEVCLDDGTYAGLRDRAMFALAYSTGPRVHEVAGLKVKDVTSVKGEELMYEVRIIGKGNKERPVKPVLLAAQRSICTNGCSCEVARPGHSSATSPGPANAPAPKELSPEKRRI